MSKSAFFRLVAVPACIAWGIAEFLALQRSRLQFRWQMRSHSGLHRS